MFGQAMQSSQSSFTVPPFPPFPAASRYIALGTVEDAINRVSNSVIGRDGIALVMGPPGTGKSIVRNLLAEKFATSHKIVTLNDVAITSPDSFYRRLLNQLDVDVAKIANDDLQLALVQCATSDEIPSDGILLLIDEAQSLPVEVLESIRATTNIMKDDQPRFTAVICGGPKLDETLAAPSMEPFNQRVATRCYLHPFNAHETRHYITEVIRGCGSNPDATITDEAIGAIHHASSGIPRLINQMMTEAIDCAAGHEQTMICERIVDQAWAQLQQLPSPIVEETEVVSDSAPVEFGSLDDSVEFGEMSVEAVSEPVVEPKRQPPIETQEVEAPVAECQATDTVEFGELASNQPEIKQPVASDEMGFAEEPETPPIKEISEEVIRSESIVVRSEMQSPVVESEPIQSDCSIVAADSFVQIRSSAPLFASTQSNVSAQQTTSIFGDFEQEEPVSVDQPNEHEVMNASPEVEMRLQEDVIQLREMATQARYGGVDKNNIAGDLFELPAESETCDAPIWLDEKDDGNDLQLRLGGNDDSDLLIIEDEVDVVPKSLQQPSGAKGRSLKIDYQEMLSNMRTGS